MQRGLASASGRPYSVGVRALTIANANDADTGLVGERLRLHGYQFDECHREHPSEWPSLDGHDLVLLLGSEWSVYWPEVAQSVSAEVALIREAQRRDIPVFGICFGNQVMAHALGGTVFRSPVAEVGWYSVDSTDESTIPTGPWLQWHYDVVTIPPGAEQLASNAVGPQAWRLGRMFCTQFHPEVTEAVVHRWASGPGGDELARLGMTHEALMADTRTNLQMAEPNTNRLVDWFCDQVVS